MSHQSTTKRQTSNLVWNLDVSRFRLTPLPFHRANWNRTANHIAEKPRYRLTNRNRQRFTKHENIVDTPTCSTTNGNGNLLRLEWKTEYNVKMQCKNCNVLLTSMFPFPLLINSSIEVCQLYFFGPQLFPFCCISVVRSSVWIHQGFLN